MKVYMFQAAYLCAEHGEATRNQLRESIKALHPEFVESEEHTYDSDYFPKGPYPNGGGEADTPQHCDHCGVFLENPLTPDGDTYVREQIALLLGEDHEDETWDEQARRADAMGSTPQGNGPTIAEWIRFYYAPGQ